jgi:short-subunit dehydrogenase
VVVITGGGTGLGKYMASGLYKNGAKVYIVGRRKEVLDDTVKEIQSDAGEGGGMIVA